METLSDIKRISRLVCLILAESKPVIGASIVGAICYFIFAVSARLDVSAININFVIIFPILYIYELLRKHNERFLMLPATPFQKIVSILLFCFLLISICSFLFFLFICLYNYVYADTPFCNEFFYWSLLSGILLIPVIIFLFLAIKRSAFLIVVFLLFIIALIGSTFILAEISMFHFKTISLGIMACVDILCVWGSIYQLTKKQLR